MLNKLNYKKKSIPKKWFFFNLDIKDGKEVSITFDQPGVYLYQCTAHKTMGMIALVVVGDGDNDVSGAKVRGKSKKKLEELLEAL